MRSILAAIDNLRTKPTASASDILDIAIVRNEEQQLQNLLRSVLTTSQKQKVCEYAYSQKLTDSPQMPALTKGMYAYRNSLVHAKEKELLKTTLPDPFMSMPIIQKWTYLVAVCAERAIRILNIK
jgi:DNA-directed RNA polymerase subunit L